MPTVPVQIKSFRSDEFRSLVKVLAPPSSVLEARLRASSARETFYRFASQVLDDLREFPNCYFTSGVTEGIDTVLSGRPTQVLENEYRYVHLRPGVAKYPSPNLFVSSPFSGTGSHVDLFRFSDYRSIVVDWSYLFASDLTHTRSVPKNVDQMLFGFSKSHDVADLRVGVILSRTRIPHLHVPQYDFGYVSSIACQVVEAAATQPPNLLWQQNQKFVSVFRDRNLVVGNTLLFGLNAEGERVPYYTLVD